MIDRQLYRAALLSSGRFSPADIFGGGSYAGFSVLDLDINKRWGPRSIRRFWQDHWRERTGAGAVAMLLDTSKGLEESSELVVNGGFDTDTAWTKGAGWTISDGKGNAGGAPNYNTMTQNISNLQGHAYWLSGEFVKIGNPADMRIGIANNSYDYQRTTSGLVLGFFGSLPTGSNIYVRNFGSGSWTIDNVSARRILGNHLFNVNAAPRPSWVANNGIPYLNFDGVDDGLFSQLVPGSEVTICICWRPPSSTDNKIVVGGGDSANNRRCYLGVGDGSAASVLAGGWGAHTAGTIKGVTTIGGSDIVTLFRANTSFVELWLNGELEYRGAASGSPQGTTAGLALGAWNNGGTLQSCAGAYVYRVCAVNRYIPDGHVRPLMRAVGQGIVSY